MKKYVSDEQMFEFANYVQKHPAFEHIKEQTQQELFNKFVIGDDKLRAEVSNVMLGLIAWESTLNQIINSHTQEKINN